MVLSSDVLTSLVSLLSTSSTNIGMTSTKIIHILIVHLKNKEIKNIN
jgi:hypothetical protein